MPKNSEHYFHFDASLRVGGCGAFHKQITERTRIIPSHVHLKGEPRHPRSKFKRKEDIWLFSSQLSRERKLDAHVNWVWSKIKPHKKYFRQLIKKAAWADLMVGCRSDCPWPVLTIDKASLEILRELEISLSFNFTLL